MVAEHKEEELRFSVSCKFHMFTYDKEMEEFYQGKKERLSAEKIIEVLVEEVEKRGRLASELSKEVPLYKLAPVLVQEFVVPFAPNSEEIENMWT